MKLNVIDIIASYFLPLFVATKSRGDLVFLLKDMGHQVSITDEQAGLIRTIIDFGQITDELISLKLAFKNDTDEEPGALVERSILLAQTLNAVVSDLKNIQLNQIAQLPAPLNDAAWWPRFAEELPNYLLMRWLYINFSFIYESLHFSGVITETTIQQERRVIRDFDWEQLGTFLSDPTHTLAQHYKWGDGFNHSSFISNLWRLLNSLSISTQYGNISPQTAETFYGSSAPGIHEIRAHLLPRLLSPPLRDFKPELKLSPVPHPSQTNEHGLFVNVQCTGNPLDTIQLNPDWSLDCTEISDLLNQAVGIAFHHDGATFQTTEVNSRMAIKLIGNSESADEPLLQIGNPRGSRFEVLHLMAEMGVDATDPGTPEIFVSATTQGGSGPGLKFYVYPGDADNFLKKILGDNEIAITADLGLAYSSHTGLNLQGGGGFEIIIPTSMDMGPIEIKTIRIGLSGGTNGLLLEAAVSGDLDLNVLQFIADDVGIRATLYPATDGNGLIGPLDMKLGFKPPNGLGVLIKAGPVKGGGYLEYNEERQEYAGVGEIVINDVICLSAIGILTTKMPDGSKDWSLFLSVFSTFPPLGPVLGFYLKGIGGLVGINRTLDDEVLRGRMLSGAMDSILFPENPVENAPRILNDIRAVFPPCADQYIVGLMAKFVWGETTASEAIGEIDLGIMIELPDPLRIILMGQLSIKIPPPLKALPAGQAAETGAQSANSFTVIELNADVLGILDLTAGTMAIDAMLRDSGIKLIQIGNNDASTPEEEASKPKFLFCLYGDMAFRADMNDKVNFLYSVGGFHPKFNPPVGFPDLRRVTAEIKVSKGGQDVAGVSLKLYHAITSQTFQMGGRLDVWATFSGFSAAGYIEMDALIHIKPFGFDFHTGFGVVVKAGSVTLMGVEVSADMKGPSPFEIIGYAQFEILKIKKKINLEITLGDEARKPPEVFDVGEMVYLALADRKNWGTPEEKQTSYVLLRERPASTQQPISPFSTIEVSQRIAPLNIEIEAFGHGIIDGEKKFEIEKIFIGSEEQTPGQDHYVEEWFAPGNFFSMDDKEKIEAPSFEKMDAGLLLNAQQIEFGGGIDLDQTYEEIALDISLNHRREYKNTASKLAPDMEGKLKPGILHKGIIGTNPYALNKRNFTQMDVTAGEPSAAQDPQSSTFAQARLTAKRKNKNSFNDFKRFEVASR